MHSYRGSVQLLEAMLIGWRHIYIGFSGLVTLKDNEVEELCKRCPLDRMLLETDAPYLPISTGKTPFSHPGQIPAIGAMVAKFKGCSVDDVMKASRANTLVMYGI